MKLEVEFNKRVSRMIRDIAKREHRTPIEIVRRALGLYSFLDEELTGKEDERFLAVTDRDSRVLVKVKWL